MTLRESGDRKWKRVLQIFENKGSLGTSLKLFCSNHKTKSQWSCNIPSDFNQATCTALCETELQCGHVCTRNCHLDDKEHKEFECHKPCVKTCKRKLHVVCKKMCFQTCDKCDELITIDLECGHKATIHCCEAEEDHLCKEPCENKCARGEHACKAICGERPCPPCKVLVQIQMKGMRNLTV